MLQLWRSLWITLYNLGASNDEIRQAVMRVSFATEEDLKMAKSVKTKEKQFMDHHALINPSTPLPPKLESHRHGLKTATLSLNTECTRFKYIRNMHEVSAGAVVCMQDSILRNVMKVFFLSERLGSKT